MDNHFAEEGTVDSLEGIVITSGKMTFLNDFLTATILTF